MKKFLIFVFTVLFIAFNVYAVDQGFQNFTPESLTILEKIYKYNLSDSEEIASFSEIKYFPHLKLRDGYDLKYYTISTIGGGLVYLYALKNGESKITKEQLLRFGIPPIEAILTTENTVQAQQELALFQLLLDTLGESDYILFSEANKKELLNADNFNFSLKEKLIIKKVNTTPVYSKTPTGFKVKFFLAYNGVCGGSTLINITYEFIKNEDGSWKVFEEKQTLFEPDTICIP